MTIADIHGPLERSPSGRGPRARFPHRLQVFDFDPDAEEFVFPPS